MHHAEHAMAQSASTKQHPSAPTTTPAHYREPFVGGRKARLSDGRTHGATHTFTLPSAELVSSMLPSGCMAREQTTPLCALKRLTTLASTRSQYSTSPAQDGSRKPTHINAKHKQCEVLQAAVAKGDELPLRWHRW